MIRKATARAIRCVVVPLPIGNVLRGRDARGGLVRDWLTGAAFIAGAAAVDWADRVLSPAHNESAAARSSSTPERCTK